MGEALRTLGQVPIVMVALLASGLLMGQRAMGDLSLFDLLTGITIGTVAGAGIIDPSVSVLPVVTSMLGLALLDLLVAYVSIKWRRMGRTVTFEPAVVIKHGQPIEPTMRKVRMALADLLPELRKKDVFDLREVEYAIFEPDGTLSVLKAAQAPKPKGLPQAVLVDGSVDEAALQTMGWSEDRLRQELANQGYTDPTQVFIATLDEAGTLYAAPRQVPGPPPMRH
jgi:uncharacterized membrane protein YcaP (DUF421 family)